MSSKPQRGESKRASEFAIDAGELERLKAAVADKDRPGSEAHRLFQESQRRWDETLVPQIDRIQSAERLTQEDFSIRINFRD
jgi:hypothetical protein